jgi:RNA polymerase sigma factor (sigma-70 family)
LVERVVVQDAFCVPLGGVGIDVGTRGRPEQSFGEFFATSEPALRRALVAGFGPELGRDATSEALTYGWQNWSRVSTMGNGVGYLYRVGERWAKRQARFRRSAWHTPADEEDPARFEPGLGAALESLSRRQRQAVVLVCGFAMTHAEAAELLGVSRSSIQIHVERAMAKLRAELGVNT